MSLKLVEMRPVEELFECKNSPGYVLDFSNRTFELFFQQEIGVEIYSNTYSDLGNSKMNRLRCFLQKSERQLVAQALQALWEYREAVQFDAKNENQSPVAKSRFQALIERLQGRKNLTPNEPSSSSLDEQVRSGLNQELIDLTKLAPHPRGYAFEKFLKRAFDAYGMEARDPFRLRGEQIDGSFQLAGETYLLEAKWQNAPCGVADLHAFNGKVEGKAAWTRGLFISQSGFTSEGIDAFGKGKRLICMDGLDIYDTINRSLSLADVVALKVRRAAETGTPFLRVRDLYPD